MASGCSTDALDALTRQLRALFEVKSGYRDEASQAKLCEKHFRLFDADGSGVVDFDEFSRAMVTLNFVGVQPQLEALFDRFDEDLNGVVSYSEFAQGVFGYGAAAASVLAQGKTRSLLESVRTKILDSGGKNGIRTLGVLLRRMDQNGNGVIELEEFRDGLRAMGLDREMEASELQRVFRHFDRDNSGKITVEELLRGLRGAMPKRRIKLVKQAFACLDTNGDGTVTMDEVEKLYDASQHPEVLAGRWRPRDALREFMHVFEEAETKDGTITWHEFLSYYKDLSAGIENDNEFELMVRNAWHLSGGSGACVNTTCRRLLVTFRDGTQRVMALENDLGITGKDKRKIIEKLQAQGVTQIADVSLG